MGQWVYKAGLNGRQPIALGFGVQIARNSPQDTGDASGNASLTNQNGDTIKLWVHDITSDFKMEGATAQSRFKREFYPHNFVQPSFKVKGQCADNYQYNTLAEFIGESQHKAVFHDEQNLKFPTIVFELAPGGVDTARNHKGAHGGLTLRGFVPSFERGATRFEFAKEYEFDFVVTRSEAGFMGEDDRYKGRKLLSWAELITKATAESLAVRGTSPYVTEADSPDYGPLTVPPSKAANPVTP